MGSIPNGVAPSTLFALVSYIPDPLALFLDELRLELDSACKPHAHVTILPPRPVCNKESVAVEELAERTRNFVSFDVDLGEVAKFDGSDVIYISVETGLDEIHRMHDALNHGAVCFKEKYSFHPHITLAQNIEKERVEALHELARQRWAEYQGPRSFGVENLAFVRNGCGSEWIDLAIISLAKPVECLTP